MAASTESPVEPSILLIWFLRFIVSSVDVARFTPTFPGKDPMVRQVTPFAEEEAVQALPPCPRTGEGPGVEDECLGWRRFEAER